jgi:DNA-directed RNA polymerase subunit omega
MRLEEIISTALERLGHDKYLLANTVAKRATELHKGAKPLVGDVDLKKNKLTDIALREIAEGKITVTIKQ